MEDNLEFWPCYRASYHLRTREVRIKRTSCEVKNVPQQDTRAELHVVYTLLKLVKHLSQLNLILEPVPSGQHHSAFSFYVLICGNLKEGQKPQMPKQGPEPSALTVKV